MAFPSVGRLTSYVNGLNRTKELKAKFTFSVLELRHLSSALAHLCIAAPGSQAFRLTSGLTSSPPHHHSQAFGLGPNYTTSFPHLPASRWQIIELLSLHNHVINICVYNHTHV